MKVKIQFPSIQKVFPSIIVQDIVGIQPMHKLPEQRSQYEITQRGNKWCVRAVLYGLFVFGKYPEETETETETETEFDTKAQAEQYVMLKKLEQ
jgi:hypothetical protein